MSSLENNPRKKHILSFRVSDAEWEKLQATSKEDDVDVSSLLRQSLKLLLKHRQG